MELLIAGIDGGTAEIFDAFDMPFWQKLRASAKLLDVEEDIVQRGWARILSGQGAEENGGLYMMPKLDGTRDFTPKFGYKEMSSARGFAPIWKFAQDAGQSIGLMNIPTTSPAQKVDGFYVAGGGGGIFQGGLPDDALYPSSAQEILERNGYIFDIRLGAEGFQTIPELCDRLEKMMVARTDSFIELAKTHGIGFGFLAYRATTVLLYLAMSEIAFASDGPRGKTDRASWSPEWLPHLDRHFRTLDQCLERLFTELSPKHHLIVSDHSMVPWTHNVDFNGFLAAQGLSRYDLGPKDRARNLMRVVARPRFRARLSRTPLSRIPGMLSSDGGRIRPDAPAFSAPYVHGFYINDAKRFGGPIAEENIEAEVNRLVALFNWETMQAQIPMRAAPYRANYEGAPKADLMPDIKIHQSGFAFPIWLGENWYEPNPDFAPVTSILGVSGMHSGQKGDRPVLMADQGLADLVEPGDPMDLRLAHLLTKRLYASSSSQ
ncbi:MAG: hypothetical protein CMN25_11030 [Salinicola sp.]|nr:hypothetical protein [Salinicola sp.]